MDFEFQSLLTGGNDVRTLYKLITKQEKSSSLLPSLSPSISFLLFRFAQRRPQGAIGLGFRGFLVGLYTLD